MHTSCIPNNTTTTQPNASFLACQQIECNSRHHPKYSKQMKYQSPQLLPLGQHHRGNVPFFSHFTCTCHTNRLKPHDASTYYPMSKSFLMLFSMQRKPLQSMPRPFKYFSKGKYYHPPLLVPYIRYQLISKCTFILKTLKENFLFLFSKNKNQFSIVFEN